MVTNDLIAIVEQQRGEIQRLRRVARNALDFLKVIEGHGYGGMSSYDCARHDLEVALGSPSRDSTETGQSK